MEQEHYRTCTCFYTKNRVLLEKLTERSLERLLERETLMSRLAQTQTGLYV